MYPITAKYLEQAADELGLDYEINENFSDDLRTTVQSSAITIDKNTIYQLIACATRIIITKHHEYYNDFIKHCGELQTINSQYTDITIF